MADYPEASDIHLSRSRIHLMPAVISGMKQVATNSSEVEADRMPRIMKIRWIVVIIVKDDA